MLLVERKYKLNKTENETNKNETKPKIENSTHAFSVINLYSARIRIAK